MKYLKVMPNLFLVRINKKEQKDFKEKLSKNSPFFTAVTSQHNARNMKKKNLYKKFENK